MKFSLKKEIPILAIIAIPFVYLAYLWNSLPEKIPIHWNIRDPKKKLEKMGNKFANIKFFLVLMMSLLAVFILYSVQNQSGSNIKVLNVLVGFLIVGLGNYFPAVKPNYFMGIRTPWTLENETVWKETHKMSGKLWFFGGAILTLLALALPAESSLTVFLVGVAILAVVPVIFSYMKYKALKS